MAAEAGVLVPLVITNEEYVLIPEETRSKLIKYLRDLSEETAISTALLNSTKFNYDKRVGELETELAVVRDEYSIDKRNLENTSHELEEVGKKMQETQSQLLGLQQSVERLELETSQYRQQRDIAIDERDNYLTMIERRNTEAKRYQADVQTLSSQLQAAVMAKCEALAKTDDIQTQQYTLTFKEKQMEKQKELLDNQIKGLNEDLNNHSTQIMNLRREHTARSITLETQLSQKTEELNIALSSNDDLMQVNALLNEKLQKITEKLREQQTAEITMRENYQQEIQAQHKLSELYKSMTEDTQAKTEELETAVDEMQKLLQSASHQYNELEAKYKEEEKRHAEETEKKNVCIKLLKEELESANQLVQAVRQESLQHTLEDLSPAAAAASKLIKSGMTLTQIYSRYVSVSEELIVKTEEVERLDELVKSIVDDIEEKTPLLEKQREDYHQALENIRMLTEQVDKFVEENNVLRVKTVDAEKRAEYQSRENKRYRTELADLARQVCHLLNEVQASHSGLLNRSPNNGRSGAVNNSSTVISQKLVLFRDIEELQAKNQNLLAVVRELSSRQEEMERASAELNPEEIMSKLSKYEEDAMQMRVEQEQHVKMMGEVLRQRDMYRDLYQQNRDVDEAMDGDELSTVKPSTPLKANSPLAPKSPGNSFGVIAEKERLIAELQKKLDENLKAVKELQDEHASYRVERQTNERELQEQIEKMRNELREVRTENGKLLMQSEYSEIRFKTIQLNIDSYKKQIVALEGKNKCYSETILKHEQSLAYLKDETLKAQTSSSRAEVSLQYLQQEHHLLQEQKTRLMAEREAAHRENKSQSLLLSNLDLIRLSVERVEVDGRLRLESRLDESVQECSALRRRLEEEQDRFRELRDNLERKTETAYKTLNEEQELAKRAKEELNTTRAELSAKCQRVEELEKRVKELLTVPVPSKETKTSVEMMERRLKDLERDYNLSQVKLKTALQQLSTSQQSARQYCVISESAEKQLSELMAQFSSHKEVCESRIVELTEAAEEYKAKADAFNANLDSLSKEVTAKTAEVSADFSATKSDLDDKTKELAHALADLSAARVSLADLSTAVQLAEEKYAHEVVLHSADINTLTALKEQISRMTDEAALANHKSEQAENALSLACASYEERHTLLASEVDEFKRRTHDLDAQNALLHNQIQELSSQLATLKAGTSHTRADNSLNSSLNVSVSEETVFESSSDELLQIIKYLRREKDIAVTQFDVLRLEGVRLRSELESTEKQLEEAKKSLLSEREQTDASMAAAGKHSELLRKLDTLNAIMDSNHSLRAERDSLQIKLAETSASLSKLEADLVPLKEHGLEYQAKIDAMEAENAALRGEAARLRQRNNFLIERSNKASPEDWRKLQQERENLIRQLGTEKEAHQKLQEEARGTRQEKARLEESIATSNRHHTDEIKRNKEEANNLNTRVAQLQQECTEAKSIAAKRNDEVVKLTAGLATAEAALSIVRNKEIQVRKIAKKYKTQFEELTKSVEEAKITGEEKEKALRDALEAASTRALSTQTLEEIREEGRREAERRVEEVNLRHTDVVRELSDQVTSSNEVTESLRKEIEALKEAGSKSILIQAKQKIVKCNGEINALKEQLAEAQSRCTVNEQTIEENLVRMSSLKSQYDARVARAEKETADLRAEKQQEKERLDAEIKNLSQRLNQLQRTLYNIQQQGKPSTSSVGDKPTSEPPTANIKPMAGPTSTATKPPKQAQPSQQTLAPWTGRGETPFASIRPMSMQSRTVAVLPTSQSTGQPVMVAPQQQLVHTTGIISCVLHMGGTEALSSSPTSSHTDYMPATSSAGLGQVRQVIVEPRVLVQDEAGGSGVSCQMEEPLLAAESTQDNEAQQPTCMSDEEDVEELEQQQPPAQAVALVQPRIEQQMTTQTTQTQPQQVVEQSAAISQASSSNTVTTTQAPGLKRQREMEGDSSTGRTEEDPVVASPLNKRVRLVVTGSQNTVTSESGLEVEYQVPTSSQRDQEDEIVIVDSEDDEEEEEEEMADEGLEIDCEPEFDDVDSVENEPYEVESYDRDDQDVTGFDEDDGPDMDDMEHVADEDNNEVEVLEDSGDEVPNQSESVLNTSCENIEPPQQHQSEPSSSEIDTSFGRSRTLAPLSRQQQTLLLTPQYEDQGDDSIVPSTPTLFVPRRSDGFGEAVSSPQVPQQQARFTFSEANPPQTRSGVAQVAIEGMDDTRMDLTQLEDSSSGRSVPTTPLLPQVDQSTSTSTEPVEVPQASAAVNIPSITVTEATQDSLNASSAVEAMPPPLAQQESESSQADREAPTMESGEDILEITNEGAITEGVSSQGEKPQQPEVDEGREAVASVQRGTRGGMARRSGGRVPNRPRQRGNERRTPIVWNEPGSSQVTPMPSPVPQQRIFTVREPPRMNLVPMMMQQPSDMMMQQRAGIYPQQRGTPRGRRMRGGRLPPKGFNAPYQGRF